MSVATLDSTRVTDSFHGVGRQADGGEATPEVCTLQDHGWGGVRHRRIEGGGLGNELVACTQ